MPANPKAADIGLLGLGIIGTRVAANLSKAGHRVWVWNRTPKSVPCSVGTPSEVAVRSGTILLFLKDGPAVLSCIQEMLSKLTPSHLVINHSTVSPEETKSACDLVEKQGARFLDAPFTGSRDAAASNALVYYVGGDKKDLERARPILELTSHQILHMGSVGHASLVKIATNMITASSVTALAQALAMVQSAGISGEAFAKAIEHNAARSGATDMKLPAMLSEDFDPRFSLSNMTKDMNLAKQLLERAAIPSGSIEGFLDLAKPLIEEGSGSLDFSVVYRSCMEKYPS